MPHSFINRLISAITLLSALGLVLSYCGIKPIIILALVIGSTEIYSLEKTITPLIIGLICTILIHFNPNLIYLCTLLVPIPFVLSWLDGYKKLITCSVACAFLAVLQFHWQMEAMQGTILVYLSAQIIASLSDTLGYLVGKLLPFMPLELKASPKKTLSGFIGATIISSTIYYLCSPYSLLIHFSFATTLFLSIGAAWGDLLLSTMKRLYGVKDFSALIPGHGGLLDRADSLIGVTLCLICIA